MEPIKTADIKKDEPAKSEKETPQTPPAPQEPINPVQKELERVTKKSERTQVDKLLYTKKRVEKQLSELGVTDDEDVPLGTSDDDKSPVTRGELKEALKVNTQQTALQLADSIEDEHSRELAKYHINNTIRSTGNPQEDLRNALLLVNGVKNSQVIEEIERKNAPKQFNSAPGAPAKGEGEIFTPTAEESMYMRAPFNMTKEDILRARQASQPK